MRRTEYKEIFIFIAGTTPQVISETIYALAMKSTAVYPDEVYIITTNRGRQTVKDALIGRGILKKLSAEYRLPQLPMDEGSFIVPSDSSGKPLHDIIDASENEIMGNLITSFIREKTNDPLARLHCSLAGGRKTMSFYLGAALQLFGRPWDKLYHVLVSPEFESNPDFFYKPAKDKEIVANGKRLNTGNAEITITELPFIRLRTKLSLEGTEFRALVEEGQKEIDTAIVRPELKIRLSERKLEIGKKEIRLMPLHLMIYTAYVKYKLHRCRYPKRPFCLDCVDCFPSLLELATKAALEEMAKDYLLISPAKVEDLLYRNRDGLSIDCLRQAISKIKKIFLQELGDEALAAYYAITTSRREYAGSRHGVKVEKGRISIE